MRLAPALALAAAILLPAVPAEARSWKLFHPLAVGNLWRYEVVERGALRERLVVQVIGQQDTLGTTHFRVARTRLDPTTDAILGTSIALYRYDEPTRSISAPDGSLLFPLAKGIGRPSSTPGNDASNWCTTETEAGGAACFRDGVGMLREAWMSTSTRLTYARIAGEVAYSSASDPAVETPPERVAVAFRTWPNPATGAFRAELPAPGNQGLFDVHLYDMTGRRVRTYGVQPGFRTFSLDGVQPGLYVVEFNGKTRTLVVR